MGREVVLGIFISLAIIIPGVALGSFIAMQFSHGPEHRAEKAEAAPPAVEEALEEVPTGESPGANEVLQEAQGGPNADTAGELTDQPSQVEGIPTGGATAGATEDESLTGYEQKAEEGPKQQDQNTVAGDETD